MERGPVLEDVYDLIRGRHRDMPLWDSYFRKERYDLVEHAEPDVWKLSKYEIAKLQEVAKSHENDDEWDLVHFTHTLPEWKRNDPGTSFKRIPLADILEAVGRGADVEEVSEDAESLAAFERVLGIRFRINAGATFLLTAVDIHLWIILSNPEADPDHVLIVNLTSWTPSKDQSCILSPGDHP